MTVPLPLRPPDPEPVEKPARDTRMAFMCPGCGDVLGELAIFEKTVVLGIGGMDGDRPVGILIKRMEDAVCLGCGAELNFWQSPHLAKILRRRGYSDSEIRDIIG